MRFLVLALLLASAPPAALAAQQPPFPDTLTLARALEAALGRDPSLAGARAAVEGAEAGRAQARAAWRPTVGASGNLVHHQEPMLVAPIHTFQPSQLPEFDETLAQGRVTLGWTVWDGGAREARIAAAGARAQGAEAGESDAGMDATLEVIEAYLRVASARETVATQRARETELESEAARAERYVVEGAAPRLEVLRAQAELQEARAQGVGADAGLGAAEADLARLLGVPADAVARAGLVEVRPSPSAPATPLDVSEDHPALRGARARTSLADALVKEARSAWFPRIQGNGAVLEYGSGAGSFTAEWQAGVQADIAIVTGGFRGARIDEARAGARQARAEEEDVRETLERASDRAAAGLREAEARVAALASTVERFEELVRVQALAQQEGVGVQTDYLRALSGLFGARLGLGEARRAVVLASARLARAQGRLDPEWTRTHLEDAR